MHNFTRPESPTLEVRREPVAGRCDECGAEALASYRVVSEGGWWQVVKCQRCLHSNSRVRGPLFGAFEPLGAPR